MSTLSRPEGVPGTIAVPPTAGARLGPLPCTNMRKLFTPSVRAALAVAASEKPSATGSVPPTLVLTAPSVSPEQTSNAPEQSAKLIIIEGVPLVNAAGAVNRPSVFCVNPSSAALNERATAAYSTLHGPVVMLATLPNNGVMVPAAPGLPLE